MNIREPAEVLTELNADPEAFSPVDGRCLVMVDATRPEAAAVGARARQMPCVCVAVADDLDRVPVQVAEAGFDILLTNDAGAPSPWVSAPDGLADAVGMLADAVAVNPHASVALVQLLRAGATADIRDAVVAESLTYSALQAGPEFARWLTGFRKRPRAERTTAAGCAWSGAARGEGPVVRLDLHGAALTVTLNRPQVHNAVNTALRDGLVEAFRLAAVDDQITEIRLAGAGPSFSSGGDLTEFGTLPDPVAAHAVRTTRSIPLSLLATGLPATAYVHGRCIGAGAELPPFCSRVIAAPGTTFRLPEVAMGLVPGAGGTASIPRRIGRQRASYLILTGQPIDTEKALEWGLIDEIASS